MIAIKCPADGTLHYAEESHIGLTIRCRSCGATLKIEPQDERPSVGINQEPVEGIAEPSVTGRPLREPQAEHATSPRVIPKVYILIGAGLGAIVLMLLIAFWPDNPGPVSSQTPSGAQSPVVPETSPGPAAGVPAPARAERAPKVKPAQPESIPPCAQGGQPLRLKSGERIEPDGAMSGQSNIRIMNAGGLDAAVKLVDSVSGKTSRFVYVQAGHTFAMEGVETGSYLLQFQLGRDWIPECHVFLRDAVYGEFADPFVFLDDRIRFYTVTLSPVVGGKTRTRKIDRKRFLEGD